jgi:RNA recognition motif-containing protein
MVKKLFVGRLSYDTTEDEVRQAFAAVGTVASATLVTDRYSGRSRGFAFVEMATEAEAEEAIKKLNNATIGGRQIVVSESKPREEGGGGGGGGGGRGGYGGGGGGGGRGGGGGGRGGPRY